MAKNGTEWFEKPYFQHIICQHLCWSILPLVKLCSSKGRDWKQDNYIQRRKTSHLQHTTNWNRCRSMFAPLWSYGVPRGGIEDNLGIGFSDLGTPSSCIFWTLRLGLVYVSLFVEPCGAEGGGWWKPDFKSEFSGSKSPHLKTGKSMLLNC